ncbi:PREDICTED: acyl-CoA-binding protein homolog [Polistes canadensis]|uniref:acyl-CoA-binding protein homolog n=1 Tax=Polistes canadensis TaxID=91411 RepID=UPI000718EA23|nr:PREDICTED: acyl-CoA-binding protein homolog [Polistes canadensis]
MSLDEQFEAAEKVIKTLTKRPTDEELLELYGLFKQAMIGDCNTQKPGLFDMKAKAKWQSWNSKKGVSKEDAKKAYIELVNNLMEKYK